MLTHNDLKKGVRILLEGKPFEVLESNLTKKAQGRIAVQTKLKNLLNASVFDKNFHQGDLFEEAELSKVNAKFLYTHRGRHFFCEEKNPAKRFDLGEDVIGSQGNFLKPNQIVETLIFDEKVVSISLPIKIQLKVTEAPPGTKGDSVQGGTKIIVLETGAKVSVPLFVKEGDIVEVNTETGEYTRRIE